MKELIIEKNDSEQRIDRFLKKYFDKANTSFIYKMLRKKNIKLNGSKADPETIVKVGDIVTLYLSDETIGKFRSNIKEARLKTKLDIVYQDDNILIINKPAGLLVHGTGKEFEENVVDGIIEYLIFTGEYVPRLEKTFTPAVSNRLDRNTSGIIVATKNYEALKEVNAAIRRGNFEKYYLTIVKGTIKQTIHHTGNLVKDESKNEVTITDIDGVGKETETVFKPIKTHKGYTLLEVSLITGRTHQIRSTLDHLRYPIIGDRKYGRNDINVRFDREFGLKNQWLHGYKLVLNGFSGQLNYLNGKTLIAKESNLFIKVKNSLIEEV